MTSLCATLVHQARSVIEQRYVTTLTDSDWDRFIALLGDADARHNTALVNAAKGFKTNLGQDT